MDWFPTSIWRFNVADCGALNETLLQFIAAERGYTVVQRTRSAH